MVISTILNSIRNNDSGGYTVEGYVPVSINYSNIEGGYDGEGISSNRIL